MLRSLPRKIKKHSSPRRFPYCIVELLYGLFYDNPEVVPSRNWVVMRILINLCLRRKTISRRTRLFVRDEGGGVVLSGWSGVYCCLFVCFGASCVMGLLEAAKQSIRFRCIKSSCHTYKTLYNVSLIRCT